MDFLQSNWVKYGVYYGIISILVQLVSYYVTPISTGLQMGLSFVIMIALFYLAGKAERETNGGVLSYGQALKTTFLTGLTGTVVSILFSIILIQLIDPGLVEKLTEIQIEATRSMMEKLGTSEDKIAEIMEKMEEDAPNAFTPGKMLLTIPILSIFVLIFAAIVSIFIKKNEDPNQVNVQDIGEV